MRTTREQGFSLIELLVAVVVISLLLSIAIPTYNAILRKRQLIQAAEQLSADLKLAKIRAISSNKQIVMLISSKAGYFFFFDENHNNICDSNEEIFFTRNLKQYGDEMVIDENKKLVFHPRGTVNAATIAILQISTGKKAEIKVNFSGGVRVEYDK